MKKLYFLLLSVILTFSFSLNVGANPNSAFKRFYGEDRYQTAIAIANDLLDGEPNGQFDCVFLASGLNWPDAVVGTALARQLNAPILLVDYTPERSSVTLNFVKEHLANDKSIYLLGGTGVIPQAFTEYLISSGYHQENIHQIGGKDRNETSLLIAQTLITNTPNQIFLVSDENYADALSIASYTGEYKKPIMLISSSGPTAAQKEYIDKATSVFYIGDLATWIDTVYSRTQKTQEGPKQYVYGENKYETNGAVIDQFNRFDRTIFLVSGEDYPDALAGSVLASRFGGMLVFVKPNTLPTDTVNTLNHMAYMAHNPNRSLNSGPPYFSHNIWVLGGPGAVSDDIVYQAQEILNGDGYLTNYK